MNILKSQKSEIILTIVVNSLSDLISVGLLMWGLYLHDVPLPIACIIFPIIALRIIILPIYYNWLEKRTQNELIRNFIEKLKHNQKIRFIMLIPISYIITCLSFSLISLSFSFGISPAFYFISLFFGSAGNYFALFFYWFLVDLYKKTIQDNNKN